MKPCSFLYARWLARAIFTISLWPLIISAGDFTFYSVGKGTYFDQTAGDVPVARSPLPWLIHVQLEEINNGVTFADLRRSTNAFEPAVLSFSGGPNMASARRAGTQEQLDATFTNGSFFFRIQTRNDGLQWGQVDIASGICPPAPSVTNLLLARSLDPAADFTLEWEPFVGGTTNDFILCQVQGAGTAFHSAHIPGTPGALNGTHTSMTIPAGTLMPGRAYLGRLVFARTQATFTNAYPGAWGAAFWFSQTDFWMKTQGDGDTTPPFIAWSNPTEGASGVPINMPITIEFSEPMSSSVSYQASGFGANTIWETDHTKLFLTPVGAGAGGVKAIVLNPFENGVVFRDLSGNPLAADTVLSFTMVNAPMIPLPMVLTNTHMSRHTGFETELLGVPSHSYALQYSSDFTNWATLKTNVAVGGVTHFVDTNAITEGRRFYRAVAR